MPTKPTVAEKIEPIRNATPRPMAIWNDFFRQVNRLSAHGHFVRTRTAVIRTMSRNTDRRELAVEVGVGAFADGLGDFLHARGAGVGGVNLANERPRIGQAGEGDDHVQNERDLFPDVIGRVGEEAERSPRVHRLRLRRVGGQRRRIAYPGWIRRGVRKGEIGDEEHQRAANKQQ